MIKPRSKALAHLVCCAIGEGDSDDLINGEVSLAEDVQITLDQHGGFPGARTCGHRDVLLDLVSGRSLFWF